jgi:hypothetical protein
VGRRKKQVTLIQTQSSFRCQTAISMLILSKAWVAHGRCISPKLRIYRRLGIRASLIQSSSSTQRRQIYNCPAVAEST